MPDPGTAERLPVERRKHRRATFTPLRRPRLHVPMGAQDVLDASLGGLRILHPLLILPKVGARVSGTLEWLHGEPPIQLNGTVVRVERGAYAITCDPGSIPLGYLPWEPAR
jgi:hypothetical protein